MEATENPPHAHWQERDGQRNSNMPNEIHSYSDLQQQIHDDLRVQHPEWVKPNGTCPTCESYELRLAELLGVSREASVAEVRKSSFLGDASDY